MKKIIFGSDGVKIYNIKAYYNDEDNYAGFINDLISESTNTVFNIDEHFGVRSESGDDFFQEWCNDYPGSNPFFEIGFSFIDEKIVPRAFDSRNWKACEYSKTDKIIKEEYREKFDGKNIEFIFDEDTELSKDTPESSFPEYFPKEEFLKLYNILLVDLHLKADDELRGAASIEDTGLFDFKI